LSDSAVLSGGYNETGTIVFTLTGPGGFSYTQTDTVTGNGTYTASTTLPTTGTVAGTYTWTAHYSGNANNLSANDQGGTAEQTFVSKAQPTLVTTASPAVTLGTTPPTLSDSAVLSGGYNETGSIVFTLTGPGGFSYTQTDTVTGNGTYTASTTLPAIGAVAGTYTWTAHYSGNANNLSANDQGGTAEQIVVSPSRPDPKVTPFTKGYWSNRGLCLVTQGDIDFLNTLNLRNANGTLFRMTGSLPIQRLQLNNFLLGANSSNPANQLSAQLATMELNVRHGSSPAPGDTNLTNVSANSVVSDPALAAFVSKLNSTPVGGPGFLFNGGSITIGHLMTAANNELGLFPNPNHTTQLFDYNFENELETALDKANNNQNFI
jgi:hypothetical protein